MHVLEPVLGLVTLVDFKDLWEFKDRDSEDWFAFVFRCLTWERSGKILRLRQTCISLLWNIGTLGAVFTTFGSP